MTLRTTTRLERHLLSLALTLALSILPATTSAEPAATAWSSADDRIAADLKQGKPLVTFVVVPLCDNQLIDCGSTLAGSPQDLAHNVYWGAAFGQRRFFERKNSGWTRVELKQGSGALLERAIYKRTISRAPWGGLEGQTSEQLVVLQAIDGARIDDAVQMFWKLASEGGEVKFQDGERMRTERIHVAGYAGHNRLMDGVKLPAREKRTPGKAAIPSFVMACDSDSYFSDALRSAGSEPIVMTRSLMAPEGYVVDAIALALGENAGRAVVRSRAVAAYAKWQRLSPKAASTVFARQP